MIRVLIAEDEIPILRGIKLMIEAISEEFSVVCCAYNGRTAIEYLEHHAVDVIFTDINMPIASGIEIMKYASQRYPRVQMVVISGYSNFEYARQALQYGAKTYLLKPIVRSEIEQILMEIKETYHQYYAREKEQIITSAVYKGVPGRMETNVQLLYVCVGPLVEYRHNEYIIELDYMGNLDLETIVSGLIENVECVFAFEKNNANERIILIDSKEKIDMQKLSNGIISYMKTENLVVTVAHYNQMIDANQITTVSAKLRNSIKNQILVGHSSVVSVDQADNLEAKIESNPTVEELCLLVNNMELLLKKLGDYLRKEQVRQIDFYCVLYEITYQILSKNNIKENIKSETEELVWDLLLYSNSIEQLIDNVTNMFEEKFLYKKEETTEDLMKKIEVYIQEHIAEQISVSVIAMEFGVVAPYLSKLFKHYSGYTISQYIQTNRLDTAKKLLLMNEEILAKEVGELVGYPNPLYFSKIFKKKVGVYPSEYRKSENRRC